MITLLPLRLSNAYLVRGDGLVLIDTGAPGEQASIIKLLADHGVAPGDLSLILHTHVHSDHVGSTAALLEHAPVPTAFHRADDMLMARGNNGALHGQGLRGRIMARIFNGATFTPFAPTWQPEDGERLDRYGVAGSIMHTPGHTPGSISLLLDSGEAIVGDVIMGGYLGGKVLPGAPNEHYFADNLAESHRSLQRILERDPHTLYVGHGGPLAAKRVRARWPASPPRHSVARRVDPN